MSKEFLRRLPFFTGLAEADLDQLCAVTEPVVVRTGDLLMAEGSPGDSLYVVLDGEFEITQRAALQRGSGPDEILIAHSGPGDVLGEISLFDGSPRTASVRALRDSQLITISQEALLRVLAANPAMVLAIVRSVTMRLRNNEVMLRQREKMAGLGTLAAGLAHELNNPAAAAHRGATHLHARLDAWQRAGDELQASGLDPAARLAFDALREAIGRGNDSPAALDPLARSDLECALQDWLEEQGVDEAWDHASTLVAAGWDTTALARVTAAFAPTQAPLVACWVALGTSVYALLDDVAQSAGRIARVVTAVKNYAYLDQAPVQEIDVHAGLENTLVILQHKLGAGITVVRDYAHDLPRIEAYGSELNQAWTNIIDNALDAMAGQGELRLRTTWQRNSAAALGAGAGAVAVEIGDTGPGIPADIQARIFEPFFTTKPPGSGTGLGLHIAYNVVVLRHHGQIQVTSQPGQTCFRVLLPLGGAL